MARLVLVDAKWLGKVRDEYQKGATQTAWTPEVKAYMMKMSDRLAPVVPELPEGWVVTRENANEVTVTNSAEYMIASIDSDGIECEYDWEFGKPCPVDVAAYLLARFQAMQGGAE